MNAGIEVTVGEVAASLALIAVAIAVSRWRRAEPTSCSLSPRVRPVSRSASACACCRISVRCSTIAPAACTSSGSDSRRSSSRSSRWSRGTMQDPDIGTLRAFSMTVVSSSTVS